MMKKDICKEYDVMIDDVVALIESSICELKMWDHGEDEHEAERVEAMLWDAIATVKGFK